MLDSAVLELYRASGDTSASAVAHSRQLRKRAASLDSTYRANFAELQWIVNAASDGGITSNARFPVEPPPAPFVRGFADGSNWMLQGPLIQEAALLQVLREGWIAGAAIDTHCKYQLPPEHPLSRFPNVILTPALLIGQPLLNELTTTQLSGA